MPVRHVHHDGGTGVGLVVAGAVAHRRGPRPQDRGVELLLDDRLELGVDVRDEVLPGGRGRLAHRADHGRGLVHGELLDAGDAAQRRVVLRFEARPADEVGALQLRLDRGDLPGLLLLLLRGELGVADRAEVAEQVGGVHAVDARVHPHGLEAGGDTGVVRALLHDGEREVLGDVLGHRDGLERGAVPADRRLLVGQRSADLEPVGQRGVRRAQRLGQAGEHRHALVLLLADHRAVDAHDERRAVGDERAPELIEDEASGRRGDDVAVLVGVGLAGVGVGGDHLEEEQPSDHGHEQRHDEDAEHREAQ